MNHNDTRFPSPGDNNIQSRPYEPIEPGPSPTGQDNPPFPGQDGTDRSGFILFLGILSLFLCGPLGIIAWIMANSDLRKIRMGRLSPRKAGMLKVGRGLGIAGAVIFVAVIVAAALFLQRQFSDLHAVVRTAPLRPDQVAFAGEWYGKGGTVIRIQVDGTGDFRSRRSSVTGGRVRIEGDSLSIGILGLSKKWHIDVQPQLQNGNWTMQLDGEVFLRKADGQVVRNLWKREDPTASENVLTNRQT